MTTLILIKDKSVHSYAIDELSNNNHTKAKNRIDPQYSSQYGIAQEYDELKKWTKEGERKGRMK
jgi:hypothetical protein